MRRVGKAVDMRELGAKTSRRSNGRGWAGRPFQFGLPLAFVLVVLAILVAQLVVLPATVSATHADPPVADHTGEAIEAATVINTVDFVDLEVDEVQSVWNNATGGTFTLSFDGGGPTAPLRYDAGLADVNEVQTMYNNATGGTFTITFDGQTTGPIAYNATANTVEGELHGLPNITAVTISGTGVLGDPWVITFLDPGGQDLPEITTDDTLLTPGGATTTIATTTEGNLSVKTALEALANITDISVSGAGNSGDPWLVTFLDPGAMHLPEMTATDSLVGGSTTITESVEALSAPIDPAGIAYLAGSFLIADSEINEEPTVYDGVNVWEMTTSAVVTRTAVDDAAPIEPTGLAYNAAGNGHVYISNDIADWVQDVDLGGDGLFGTGDDSSTFFDAGAAGITDPEDVAWDPISGQVFIASGLGVGSDPRTVTPVSPGPNGLLDGVDDVVGVTMDFSADLNDLWGLAYRAASDTLLLVDPSGSERIIEVTKDGRLIRTIPIGFSRTPSDVAVAPASGGGGDNLYVVDSAVDNNTGEPPPRDGKLYELSVPFNNLAPFVDAGSDQVVAFGDPAALVGDSYDDGQGSGYTLPPFIPAFTWSKVSGPGTVTFGDDSALSTNANFSTNGVYVLELEATDGDLTSVDTVQVTMTSDPNTAPVVSAGADIEITLPSVANLSGAASDDGLPDPPNSFTTNWSKVSGPGTVTFGNAAVLDTTASFSTAGVYSLRLTVDDSVLQSSDDVTITVNPATTTTTTTPTTTTTTPTTTTTTPVPDGSISGRIVDEFGNPTPLGRAEVYTDSEFFGTFGTDSSGRYETGGLSADTYFVFLYNGDDEFFIDWFPEWYDNRPVLLWWLAKPIVIKPQSGPISGIDAQLSPLFVDMWDSVFLNSIIWMQNTGITQGCNPPTNNMYCPDDRVTRGEMAVFLVRAMGYTDNGGGNLFVDDDGFFYENSADRLKTAKVTLGCNPPANDRYCGESHVTRGQMAAFLVRAMGYTDNGGGNLFTDDDGHLFENAIDKLGTAGVTLGCNPPVNDKFCPDDFVTRGQMAAFLKRALEDDFALLSAASSTAVDRWQATGR